jgi:GxxExxY protein
MDVQGIQDKSVKHEELIRAILGCAFDVIKELRSGFLESVYENAMCIALRQEGLPLCLSIR